MSAQPTNAELAAKLIERANGIDDRIIEGVYVSATACEELGQWSTTLRIAARRLDNARLRDAINTHREEMTRRNGRTIATTTDQTLWATLEDE